MSVYDEGLLIAEEVEEAKRKCHPTKKNILLDCGHIKIVRLPTDFIFHRRKGYAVIVLYNIIAKRFDKAINAIKFLTNKFMHKTKK